MARYIRPLRPTKSPKGKAGGLAALQAMGLLIPQTYICSAKAHHLYVSKRTKRHLLDQLRRELSQLDFSRESKLAVRSSACGEDGPIDSMAGQFDSFLHVRGVDDTLNSMVSVWNSATARPGSLRGRNASTGMEVLLQQMIEPVVSGASFSRNPVTGEDEVVVEAVEGTSEALLQQGVTPRRWVIREEAIQSEWDLLPTIVLEEIARTSRDVAKELAYPADLEWAFDGKRIWWLQVRPITSLRGLEVYSNRISREYLPGLVKPLVWSINVPMINGAWVDLFSRLVGQLSIDPMSLARRFHNRAYFNMSGMGQLFVKLGLEEDTLERLLGIVPGESNSAIGFRWKMLRHLPRLLLFTASVMAFHRRVPAWVKRVRARLHDSEEELNALAETSTLLEWSERYLPMMREVALQRILSLLLHLAVGQLGRRSLMRRGISDPSVLELPDSREETLDPTVGLRMLAQEFLNLPNELRERAQTLMTETFLQQDAAGEFAKAFRAFLDRFGHLSESGNDFSSTPWREDPSVALRMVIAQAGGGGLTRRDDAPVVVSRTVTRWSNRVTKRRLDRELVGEVFSQGVYLLHLWALKLGDTLQERQYIDDAADVFHLHLEEIRSIVQGTLTKSEAATLTGRRKQEMATCASLTLPDLILGDQVPAEVSITSSRSELRGVGVSRGIYEGSVRVVRSLDEASQFVDGEVVAVPYSDIAWAPLFSRAGAIIAEAGGILSHSAIVARELGIPAVVSVSGACRIANGIRVRVDGLEGRITLLDAP